MYKEKSWRSIVKTITWRILATTTTFLLAIAFGLELEAATGLAMAEMAIKMLLYYLHERSYNKLTFGREEIAPFALWITGLPGSGKSTLAEAVYNELKLLERKAEWLDSKNVRELFPSLGYSKEERNTHIKRIGHLSKTLVNHNISVITSFISPYSSSREFVRKNVKNYIEVYMDIPIDICEKRDSSGLYAKARKGEIPNFTGINDPYEIPEEPDIIISEKGSIEENVAGVMEYLLNHKYI